MAFGSVSGVGSKAKIGINLSLVEAEIRALFLFCLNRSWLVSAGVWLGEANAVCIALPFCFFSIIFLIFIWLYPVKFISKTSYAKVCDKLYELHICHAISWALSFAGQLGFFNGT